LARHRASGGVSTHTAGCLSKYANSHPLPETNRSSSALEAGIHKSGPCLQ
jgi:hypothetical protein